MDAANTLVKNLETFLNTSGLFKKLRILMTYFDSNYKKEYIDIFITSLKEIYSLVGIDGYKVKEKHIETTKLFLGEWCVEFYNYNNLDVVKNILNDYKDKSDVEEKILGRAFTLMNNIRFFVYEAPHESKEKEVTFSNVTKKDLEEIANILNELAMTADSIKRMGIKYKLYIREMETVASSWQQGISKKLGNLLFKRAGLINYILRSTLDATSNSFKIGQKLINSASEVVNKSVSELK